MHPRVHFMHFVRADVILDGEGSADKVAAASRRRETERERERTTADVTRSTATPADKKTTFELPRSLSMPPITGRHTDEARAGGPVADYTTTGARGE